MMHMLREATKPRIIARYPVVHIIITESPLITSYLKDDPMTRQEFLEISQYLGELSSLLREAAEVNKQVFDSLLSEGRPNHNTATPTQRFERGSPAFAGSANEEAILLRAFDAVGSSRQSKQTRAWRGARSRLQATGRDWSIHHEEDYGLYPLLEATTCLYLLILSFLIIVFLLYLLLA